MNKVVLVLANSLVGLFSFRKEVIAAIAKEGYHVVISSPHDLEEKEDYFRGVGCEFEFTEVDRRGTNPLQNINRLLF